jgi:hypothetical protein
VKIEPVTVKVEEPTIAYGDVLIVEDERPAAVAIVPSRNFRQLFSSLETANRPHRCG